MPPAPSHSPAEAHKPIDGVSPFGGLLPAVLRLAAFALAYTLTAKLGLLFRTEPEKFAIFWPPNGLLLGVLLACRRCDRRLVAATAVAASLAVNLLNGDPPGVSLGFAAVNVAEPYLLAWALTRLGVGDLTRARQVFALYALAVAVCGLTAVPGAAVVVFGMGAPEFGPTWLAFWLGDAMGVMLVTPLVVSWAFRWRAALAQLTPLRVAEGAVLFAALLAVALAVFTPTFTTRDYVQSFTFPLFPFLLWAGLRFGVRGTTLALTLLSLTAIWYTGRGCGPFADPAAPVTLRLLMVQTFLSVTGLSVITLAAVVAERTRAVRALRASEERYRQVTETIAEVFWACPADLSRMDYVSPAYEAVWGRTCASLYADPASFLASLHPDDRERVLGWVRSPCRQAEEQEFRVVRPDGAVRWVYSRRFPVVGPGGAVERLVGVAGDVTDRKEAELAREAVIAQLQQAAAEIKTLRGLIPICAWCRQIRDDEGFWQRLEVYLSRHTEATFTHSICPHCTQEQLAAIGK
jgi:PAS domain S-box-containing protein